MRNESCIDAATIILSYTTTDIVEIAKITFDFFSTRISHTNMAPNATHKIDDMTIQMIQVSIFNYY